MKSVRSAIIYSSAARYTMNFLALASTMIVSRLLTPDEIGTFAVASAIVMIMSEFRMLGAGGYLIREAQITEEKVRSALGLTLIISWGLGLVVLASAWPISVFYELPPLAYIFAILSVSFFLAPYISIPASLLSRDMDFIVQFKVRFFSSLVGFVTTIGLILAGASYYSLALGQTAIAVVNFLMFCKLKPKGMVWRPRFRDMGEVASFGIFTSLANFFRKFTVTVPDMVIGKMGTTAQVGMFSRSLGFIQFVSKTIVMGVKPVALPHLSEVRRKGGDINEAYIRASVMIGGLTWPVLAVASVVSLPAIRLFFGDQWDAAAGPASLLAYWAMLRTIHIFASDLLTAMHKEKMLALKEGLIFSFYFGGIILVFPNGLLAVARVFAFVSVIDLLVTSAMLLRYTGLNPVTFFKAWLKNAVLTLLCWISAWSMYTTFDQSIGPVSWGFLWVALLLPLIWILGVFIVSHPLRFEVTRCLVWLREKYWSRPK
jgi:O-antigen/teichoic acid export membrane protein